MTIFTAGIIALIFTWISFKKPVWALSAILALLPTYLIRLTIFGLPTTLLELLILAFLLGLAASKPDYKKLAGLGHLNWAIGLFMLSALVSVLVSPEKTRAIGQLKAFFVEPVLLFYSFILLFNEKQNLKLALRSVFFSSNIISLFGLFQYFTFFGLPIRFWGSGLEPLRIVSLFEYPNALALFLAPLIGLFFTLEIKNYLMFENKWISRTGLTLMSLALLLTFSRGAWLAVLITLSLLFVKELGLKRTVYLAATVVLIGLMLPEFRERLLAGVSDPSSQAHWDLMTIGVNKVFESPFLGNGLYGFRATLEQSNFAGEILNYPHNIFLNFWLEIGLMGLLAFGWIINLALHQQKKYLSVEALAASVFLLIVILHGLVDAPYFKNDLAILFWFAISLFYITPTKNTA